MKVKIPNQRKFELEFRFKNHQKQSRCVYGRITTAWYDTEKDALEAFKSGIFL